MEKEKNKTSFENFSSNYESINSMYKELHLQRMQNRNQDLNPLNKENSIKKDEINKNSNKIEKNEFYINKLKFYPPEDYKNYMLSFRDLLYEDLLKAKTLQSCFMTTFGYDSEFIEELLKSKINVVIANDWDKSAKYEAISQPYKEYKNFTLIQPFKNKNIGFGGCFHPKLWLLKFPKFLRVVVTSGNLTREDWTTWSQTIWFQDFKKKSEKILENIQIKKVLNENTFNFDEDFENTLKEFISKIIPNEIKNYKEILQIDLDEYIYEIFPTNEYVKNSYEGVEMAATLFFDKKKYYSESFPKKILCKYKGNKNYYYNEGVIPHLKIILIYEIDDNDIPIINDDTSIYFGSHNFSPAAWGRFEKNYKQFTVSNTELGVFIPPKINSAKMKKEILERFPFNFPPEKYNDKDLPFLRIFEF